MHCYFLSQGFCEEFIHCTKICHQNYKEHTDGHTDGHTDNKMARFTETVELINSMLYS